MPAIIAVVSLTAGQEPIRLNNTTVHPREFACCRTQGLDRPPQPRNTESRRSLGFGASPTLRILKHARVRVNSRTSTCFTSKRWGALEMASGGASLLMPTRKRSTASNKGLPYTQSCFAALKLQQDMPETSWLGLRRHPLPQQSLVISAMPNDAL